MASRLALKAPLRTSTAAVGQRRAASAGYGRYGNHFINERRKVEHHAAGSAEMWRKITYYIATPTIIAIAINTWNLEQAHHRHEEKLIEENGGERPERIVYDYMNVRNKPYFPWGPQSLFFNPETCALMLQV